VAESDSNTLSGRKARTKREIASMGKFLFVDVLSPVSSCHGLIRQPAVGCYGGGTHTTTCQLASTPLKVGSLSVFLARAPMNSQFICPRVVTLIKPNNEDI